MATKKRRRKVRQSKAPWSLRLGVLITTLVIIVVAAGVMMAPFFDITEVYCEGASNLKNEDIIATAGIENGSHILMVNVGKARSRVEELPLVREASVRRVFPNKICISVTERQPSAYIMCGAECLAIDSEGVVLEEINDSRAAEYVKQNTPAVREDEKKSDSDNDEKSSDKDKEDMDKNKDDEADSTENEDKAETEDKSETEDKDGAESADDTAEGGDEETVPAEMPYKVPLVAGIDVEDYENGNTVRAKDEARLEKMISVLGALGSAQLIERATYLDMTDTTDIRLIIEKRLDIYLGKAENIEYKSKFLAEVINTKISAYENVVMDYRGDDVFVRRPEDGKDRSIRRKDESDDKDEDNENSDDSDKEDDKKSDDEDENDRGDNEDGDSTDEDDEKTSDDEAEDASDEEEESDEDKKAQSSMSLSE